MLCVTAKVWHTAKFANSLFWTVWTTNSTYKILLNLHKKDTHTEDLSRLYSENWDRVIFLAFLNVFSKDKFFNTKSIHYSFVGLEHVHNFTVKSTVIITVDYLKHKFVWQFYCSTISLVWVWNIQAITLTFPKCISLLSQGLRVETFWKGLGSVAHVWAKVFISSRQGNI